MDPEWLSQLVGHVAEAIMVIDSRRPVWTSTTTGRSYQPGIGPHPETETLRLIATELERKGTYGPTSLNVPYPTDSRKRCDLVLGQRPLWAVEAKMLRLMGDNGKANDNMLMHILSPYSSHRSALTDCEKLAHSGFPGHLAILIYGFDYPAFPMDPAIEAFERLAQSDVALGPRAETSFSGLIHPVHRQGRVFAWELPARVVPL